jgi:hypothetical protein
MNKMKKGGEINNIKKKRGGNKNKKKDERTYP